MSREQKIEFARILYVKEGVNQKEIAQRVGSAEATIRRWREKHGWDKQKETMVMVKDNQLSSLYRKLEKLNQHVESNQDNLVTSKDVDAIVKLTSAIKKLEVDTSLGEIIDVAKKFTSFVQEYDLEMAKKIANHFDTFIKDQL